MDNMPGQDPPGLTNTAHPSRSMLIDAATEKR